MIFRDHIWEFLERNKIRVVTQSVEWSIAKQILNASYQAIYQHALRMDKTFYQKSAAFSAPGSGNTITKPADCYKIELIEITDATPRGARRLDIIEFQEVNLNDYATGTAAQPIYREDRLTFDLFPASAGVIHYLRSIPYVTDEEQELIIPGEDVEPLFSFHWDEAAMLYACKLLRARQYQISDTPTEASKLVQSIDQAMASLKADEDPLAIFKNELPKPR